MRHINPTMKRLVFALLACFAAVQLQAAELNWMTDLPKAQAQAKKENKLVMLDFTGSDWCGWCIKLNKEVFSKPEFAAYAKTNLVLVEVDFPRSKPQSAALKKANEALGEKYGIEGYPTIIVLNGEGKKVGKLGYMPGGPKAFTTELDKLKSKK
jgi:thioredoxin-related protein